MITLAFAPEKDQTMGESCMVLPHKIRLFSLFYLVVDLDAVSKEDRVGDFHHSGLQVQ